MDPFLVYAYTSDRSEVNSGSDFVQKIICSLGFSNVLQIHFNVENNGILISKYLEPLKAVF